jgi:hypothetical protein
VNFKKYFWWFEGIVGAFEVDIEISEEIFFLNANIFVDLFKVTEGKVNHREFIELI